MSVLKYFNAMEEISFQLSSVRVRLEVNSIDLHHTSYPSDCSISPDTRLPNGKLLFFTRIQNLTRQTFFCVAFVVGGMLGVLLDRDVVTDDKPRGEY